MARDQVKYLSVVFEFLLHVIVDSAWHFSFFFKCQKNWIVAEKEIAVPLQLGHQGCVLLPVLIIL